MFKKKAEEEKKDEEVPAAERKPATGTVQSEESKPEAEKAEAAEKPAEAEKAADENPAEPEKPTEPDWKNLYAVTLADFDNYKKRAARDREDVYRYAESDILKDVLPVVDNLTLALANAKAEANSSTSGKDAASPLGADHPFVRGVQLVYDGLLKALADHGAKPMDDLVGKELDPNFHEAIATLPNAEVDEGKISNVVKTGWTLNDKLLRAAQVVVSAGAPEQQV